MGATRPRANEEPVAGTFRFLRNTRKTVAVSSAPRKERRGPSLARGAYPRPLRSFRSFNFRLWTAGSRLSNVGTWMQRVAQDWLVLTRLTYHDASALGVVMGLQFAPQLLFLPWTGSADRLNQRKILLFTQASMGILALVLRVLTWTLSLGSLVSHGPGETKRRVTFRGLQCLRARLCTGRTASCNSRRNRRCGGGDGSTEWERGEGREIGFERARRSSIGENCVFELKLDDQAFVSSY